MYIGIIRYIFILFAFVFSSTSKASSYCQLVNEADVGISVCKQGSSLVIQGVHSKFKELDLTIPNLSSFVFDDGRFNTAHFNIKRLEKHLLLKYSNSVSKEYFALLIDFSANVTLTRPDDTYTGYKQYHKYAIKTDGNITNRHNLTFFDLILSANNIYNHGTLRSCNWHSCQNYLLNTGIINMGVDVTKTSIDIDLTDGYNPQVEKLAEATPKPRGTIDNYGTWTSDGKLNVKDGININNYGGCSFENLNMSGGVLRSNKSINESNNTANDSKAFKGVNVHGSLTGKVTGIDIGSGHAVKVNNCDIKDVDVLNIDKTGVLYSSGGLNLSVNNAYYNEGIIACNSDINLNINSIFPRVNGGVVVARNQANVSFSTPSKRNRKIGNNNQKTGNKNGNNGTSFSLNEALASINAERLRNLIKSVFGAKGEADLGGDGEHIGAGNIAGNKGKLRIRTDHYLNTITHITTYHYTVDPRTGAKTFSHTTHETKETGYVFNGSTYSEQDVPMPSNQAERNKLFDSEQARMAEFNQVGKAIGMGLIDALRAAAANSKYRQLINQLRDELAKAGLSKDQIDALMNCKDYQDALKFYSSLAEFRTREDGSEGLSILDTKESFINTLKDCWDNLAECLERLDAPTGFFVRDHIVPILVGISPWGRGVKLVGGIANGVKTAISTETAIKRVAIAAGISEELNRFNIFYSKKHSNNSNKNNGNNNSKGSKNNTNLQGKERIQNTAEEQMAFIKNGIKNGDLIKSKKKIGGYQSWLNKKNGLYYTKDSRHKDIEVWEVKGHSATHKGSLDPKTGKMLDKKANHPTENVS